MAFSINTNINAMQTNIDATLASNSLDQTIAALAAGTQSSSSDVAGFSIASGMSAQVAGTSQAIQNANSSIGMLQVADGGMSSINDNMQRIQELTIRADNGTMSDSDRAAIQKEIDGLLQASNDIANNTSFNGIKLLNGTGGSSGDGTFVTQTGANAGETQSVTIGSATVDSLVGSIDITTQEGRDAAFTSLDSALKDIGNIRSDLGSAQNELASSARNSYISKNNTAASESMIKDIDFAQESANFSQQSLMTQVGVFAQSQSNLSNARVASLLA